MATMDQAIAYCERMAKKENAVLFERCRRVLMMNNLPEWTEQKRWDHSLEEAEIDTYSLLSKIAGMRLE
jgi:hypothetical protein